MFTNVVAMVTGERMDQVAGYLNQ